MKTSIIIGLLIGAMAFPMIIIPLMGVGIVVWSFYILFHDIIWQGLHHRKHAE